MIPGPKLNITSNKMNKDYENKFASDIWCLFGGIIFCILTFYIFLFKDGYYNFPVFTKPSDENIQTCVMQLLSTEFF